jgi:hypothetical protein
MLPVGIHYQKDQSRETPMRRQQLPNPQCSFIVTTRLARIPMYACAGWGHEDQRLSKETTLERARTRGVWSG